VHICLYVINLPAIEPRLQRRFEELVIEHLADKDKLAAGLRALPETSGSFAAAQGAWRFYHNPRVSLPQLIEPSLAAAREASLSECDQYLLAVHDWSVMGYAGHESKKDRVPVKTKHPIGYEMHSVLALSDRTGSPLATVYHGLRAEQGVLSTRQDKPLPVRQHLNEVSLTMRHLGDQKLGRPLVHLIDAEADSVGHLRRWNGKKELFAVRGDEIRRVQWQGREVKVSEVCLSLEFSLTREVEFDGQQARQYVAETEVVLHRPARQHRIQNGQHIHKSVKGKPLKLRLVVSELRDEQGQALARWLLWTNIYGVTAQTIAQWYFWRWKIETYFKLLKSAGHHLEQWQQTTADAIARRLLVAATACIVVWRLARAEGPQAEPARQFLVRLSGRLMKRNKKFTEPALLAGLWNLLAILDTLENYTVAEIKRMAAFILPSFESPESG
jgi:hypothetical protein